MKKISVIIIIIIMQNRTTIITITNRVVSRLKIIAFKRCGGPKNVPKIKEEKKKLLFDKFLK